MFDANTVSLPEVDTFRPLTTMFLFRFWIDDLSFCTTERTAFRSWGLSTGACIKARTTELSLLLLIGCSWCRPCWPCCWLWTDIDDLIWTLVKREALTTSLNDGPWKVLTPPWSATVMGMDRNSWSELLMLAGSINPVLWGTSSMPRNESRKYRWCNTNALNLQSVKFVYIIICQPCQAQAEMKFYAQVQYGSGKDRKWQTTSLNET